MANIKKATRKFREATDLAVREVQEAYAGKGDAPKEAFEVLGAGLDAVARLSGAFIPSKALGETIAELDRVAIFIAEQCRMQHAAGGAVDLGGANALATACGKVCKDFAVLFTQVGALTQDQVSSAKAEAQEEVGQLIKLR